MLRSNTSSWTRVAWRSCSRLSGRWGRVEEGHQQRVLALAERDLRAVGIGEAPAAPVQHPAGEAAAVGILDPRRGGRHLGAAQDDPHPREQLAQAVGLHEVVVGTEFEADHPVDLVPAMAGGDDHRQVAPGAQVAQQVEPVLRAQPQVQHDEVEFGLREPLLRLRPVGRRGHGDVVIGEVVRDDALHCRRRPRRGGCGSRRRARSDPEPGPDWIRSWPPPVRGGSAATARSRRAGSRGGRSVRSGGYRRPEDLRVRRRSAPAAYLGASGHRALQGRVDITPPKRLRPSHCA